MPDSNEKSLPKFYDIEEAAMALKMSTRTLWRYIDAGMFKSLVIMPRQKRRRVLFTDATFEAFRKEYNQPEQRVKRVYNRTKKRYQRRKKTA